MRANPVIKFGHWSLLKFHIFLSYPSIEFPVTDCMSLIARGMIFEMNLMGKSNSFLMNKICFDDTIW